MTAFLSPFSGTQVVSNLPPGPEGISISCFMYSDANALNSTCNERTDLICTKGCKGPFATATECQLLSGTDVSSASTTQVCSFDFGRDATAAKGITRLNKTHGLNFVISNNKIN
ncbi:hypothetical protein BY996DRAFT_6408676 [Phakopsora pachyrhizi]|nr:hypothetical protein BY996DRAFT_6408676 [Phakopsora pachyrhizi]